MSMAPSFSGHLEGVQRIGVFRALMLGDMLCAVPALRALRQASPDAEIVLIGLPWAQAWTQRCPHVDRFIAFPGIPGLPEQEPDIPAFPGFLQTMQHERFDLVLQLHGSGGLTNPLVKQFGARSTAGFTGPGSLPLTSSCPWPADGDEIERLLAVIDHLGLPRAGDHLEYPVRAEDEAELEAAWPGMAETDSIACVHPGAQLPSRRWLPDRFAATADALAGAGHTVVFTGTAQEKPLVRSIVTTMHFDAVDLAGHTSLWSLGALIRRARVLVCNDTGVSHVAAALGTPSVVISLGADVKRWAPRDRTRHAVLWKDMSCRPCAHPVCPVGHGCATAIEAACVIDAAQALLSAHHKHGMAEAERTSRQGATA